ncbi:cAMP-responsive element modulator isoform X1 [Xiphias gladius]|uniref:cAMP-responsive element modulator isoform X1 n=1 Tax=Xiphias gladius TaxID=8245 RepID=UPI001A981B34|nr:cAMP-responsive element modulator isoform X1 [Xiphias gladius]XP_039999161.1 cAMP-responsive element modulator isoform X1 [Xiphias gladius]XP_039999162.1 cAMP-responsive element modulator isoform X1 [Xiphias gladius]XP_039999163.1 cAMP-responsive element modulator isoform X1 [Xiphias gladius]
MDTSGPSQLDGSSNDPVTNGEENHSEASASPAAPPQVSAAAESPAVTVVQLSDGQTVQVQGVIQAPQTSVIQSPQVQTVQIATVAELEDGESVADTRKRREILSRRPSYRKILNELSFDSPTVPRIDEEKAEEEVPVSSAASASVPTSIYQTSSGQYIAVTQGRAVQLTSPGVEALQGAQTPTVASSPTPQPGTTVVQCAAQPGDSPQQFYIQGGQVFIQAATGDIPAYQLRSPNSGLAQSIVMAASPGSIQSPSSQHAEEITRKREVRLMKNREAARECRRKKKEYVKCLENRVAVLENQNKTLIEELKALKDIYCHKAE